MLNFGRIDFNQYWLYALRVTSIPYRMFTFLDPKSAQYGFIRLFAQYWLYVLAIIGNFCVNITFWTQISLKIGLICLFAWNWFYVLIYSILVP